MTTKNKKALELEIAELRSMVKSLKYKLSDREEQQEQATIDGESLPEEGYGIFKHDSVYKYARIKYNPISREAKVVFIEDVGKNALPKANANFRAQKEVVELIKRLK